MPRLILLVVAVMLLFSCGAESPAVSNEDLLGKWDVVEARRNGSVTRTFSNAYFEFQEDNKMETNFSGEVHEAVYDLENGAIVQHGGTPIRYEINEWADSIFTLNFDFMNFHFDFLLARHKETR